MTWYQIEYYDQYFSHKVLLSFLPSLSYKRNASLSSFCIASSSSSTMNLAANVTNSSNSNLPDSANVFCHQIYFSYKIINYSLSASTSSINSARIFLSYGWPIRRKISPTISHGILPDFWLSNASKAFFNTESKYIREND